MSTVIRSTPVAEVTGPPRLRPLVVTRTALRRAFAANKPLAVAGSLFALAFVGTLVGVAVDRTVITGSPAWIKPAKFMISSAIYTFTLIGMLGFVRGRGRLVGAASWITAVGLVVEDAIIAVQAYRGTTSHFNLTTPLDARLLSVMAVMVVALWGGCFLVGIALLLQRGLDRPVAWALRFGVLLALVGMSIAFFMLTPTAAQLTAFQAGQGLPMVGGHTVGRGDGGPGLPFLGWSTVAGDLRVAHFVGLHGLQVVPLVAFFVTRRLRNATKGTQTALVTVAGMAWLGLDLLLAWQALRGQSVVRPDALTLGAATTLVAATALAALAVLGRSRRGAAADAVDAVDAVDATAGVV